jgi:hypothetical protein
VDDTIVGHGTLESSDDVVLTSDLRESTGPKTPVQRMHAVRYLRE